MGEVEVTEFPPLSCHLLATRSWLPEAAWAGKGSKRGSSLLLLAQEQSQQLQSCCEVMPGAACVFLQVETDSGRVGWQPQPQRACRENIRSAASAPAPPCQALGPSVRWASWPHPYQAPKLSWEGIPLRTLGAGPGLPQSRAPLPRCCGPAETGSEGARETSWSWGLAPAPGSPGPLPPWRSCIKVLISSCPRLGAEHALAICHELVGDFATVSRRARQEEWATTATHCPFHKG